MDQVDQNNIKATGVLGVQVVGKHNVAVIVGTTAQFVTAEVINWVKDKQLFCIIIKNQLLLKRKGSA